MEATMQGQLNHLLEIVKEAQQACYDRGVTAANHMFVKD